MAGLNTSFSSQATFSFRIGSAKLPAPGIRTGFTLSTFVNGKSAQSASAEAIAMAEVSECPATCDAAAPPDIPAPAESPPPAAPLPGPLQASPDRTIPPANTLFCQDL